ERAIDLVHRDERCRHARRGLKKAAPAHALLFCKVIGEGNKARLDLALLAALRRRKVFVARDDLRRDWRGKRRFLGRQKLIKFLAAQEFHHLLRRVVAAVKRRRAAASTGRNERCARLAGG